MRKLNLRPAHDTRQEAGVETLPMGWRDERGRAISRYQDQEWAIARMGGFASAMAGLAAIFVFERLTGLGVFRLPFWALMLFVMLPMAVLAFIGGVRLERLFGVHDIRKASRLAKVGFMLFGSAVAALSLLVIFVSKD